MQARPVATSSPTSAASAIEPLAELGGGAGNFLRAYDPSAGVDVIEGGDADAYGENVDQQFPLASVAKVPIMLALLSQTMQQARPLSSDEAQLLTSMIENSDNDSTQALWDELGGGPAVQSYIDSTGIAGMHLIDGEDWGDSTASPHALAELLYELASGKLLDAPRTSLALDLLENVEADQRWGVAAAFPDDSAVAIKDGWYPTDAGPWWLNSAGISTSRGDPTVLVIMTDDQPSFDGGTQVIEGIASRVGQVIYGSAVSPTAAPGTP
jgi:beta-lactamase class A